jgi:hypothetical protein
MIEHKRDYSANSKGRKKNSKCLGHVAAVRGKYKDRKTNANYQKQQKHLV